MTEDMRQQYSVLQTSIRGNINAIRVLLMQVDNLNATVASVNDKALKTSLDANIKSIYKSINTLIDETDKLFTSLQSLKESVGINT
jgi:hypothetical protein